jgi:hypothetical protein
MRLQGSRIRGQSDLAENSQEAIAVNNRELFERLGVVDEYADEHTLLPANRSYWIDIGNITSSGMRGQTRNREEDCLHMKANTVTAPAACIMRMEYIAPGCPKAGMNTAPAEIPTSAVPTCGR